MTCRYRHQLGYRAQRDRHHDTCADDTCPGCQPCPHGHCVVCGTNHTDDTTPQTCAACVGHTRDDLAAIVDMHERLEPAAIDARSDGRRNAAPMGGDAMVMLADGRYLPAGRRSHDEQINDPEPPLLVLATWEDDWRIELGHGGGPRATVWSCADYLSTHLTLMAQRHLAFDEFAAHIGKVRARMELVLSEGVREDHADVGCFECGGRLVRRVTQRGADDHWTCGRCRRRYTDPEYHLAVRAKLEAIRDNRKAG